MPDATMRIDLGKLAEHVDVAPGGEIVLRGAFTSTRDGSIIDAATTTWPANAPGGESIDAGGLLDLEKGGFHVTSRDPKTHEVHAIASGDPAPACDAAGVTAPCVALRVVPEARTRLITVGEWTATLKGGITLETNAPSAMAPVEQAASRWSGTLAVAAALIVVVIAAALWRGKQKRFAESPAGQLLELARQVKEKLGKADAVLAAPLAPAVEHALAAVRKRRVDPKSNEGKRVIEALKRVEIRLDESAEHQRAEKEQQAADELVRDVEAALEAADEATAFERRAVNERSA